MLIIDGDYPMAFGALELNRDLTRPVREIRQATPDRFAQESYPDSETMASLPELRKAKVAAALVKVVGRIQRPGSPLSGFRSGEAAYANAQAALAYYDMLQTRKQVRILKTRSELMDHMQTWSKATDHEHLPVGFILGMEGADPILWPEHVHDWWADGLRVVSLSHYGVSTYCHGTGTGTSGGLFPPAKALLKEMDAAGMMLDLAHASDASVREAMEIFSGPVLASHQNCRALVPGERQFPDEQLVAIIKRGGVIGVSMDSWMLYKPGVDWAKIPPRRSVFPREAVTLEDFADHIDHICQLAGNSRHAAIGGDTDGQGGRAGAPVEIDTVADYQKVATVLERRGYSQDDIANVMYRNWQRFFETHLPTRTGSGPSCARKTPTVSCDQWGETVQDLTAWYHWGMRSAARKLSTTGQGRFLCQVWRPLTGVFRGTEHFGAYYGHAPKSVRAICDPTALSGIVAIAPGVLGPRHGAVTVDLVEPGHEPTAFPWTQIVTRQVFRDIVPWVVITVGSSG